MNKVKEILANYFDLSANYINPRHLELAEKDIADLVRDECIAFETWVKHQPPNLLDGNTTRLYEQFKKPNQ